MTKRRLPCTSTTSSLVALGCPNGPLAGHEFQGVQELVICPPHQTTLSHRQRIGNCYMALGRVQLPGDGTSCTREGWRKRVWIFSVDGICFPPGSPEVRQPRVVGTCASRSG